MKLYYVTKDLRTGKTSTPVRMMEMEPKFTPETWIADCDARKGTSKDRINSWEKVTLSDGTQEVVGYITRIMGSAPEVWENIKG